MSLKTKLHKRIKDHGSMFPYNSVVDICRFHGYKTSNAERILRKSRSPDIQTVYNKKGHVIGYRHTSVGQHSMSF